jgi:hypothetical protein
MFRPSQKPNLTTHKMNSREQDGSRCFLQIFAIYQTTRRRNPEDGKLHIRM